MIVVCRYIKYIRSDLVANLEYSFYSCKVSLDAKHVSPSGVLSFTFFLFFTPNLDIFKLSSCQAFINMKRALPWGDFVWDLQTFDISSQLPGEKALTKIFCGEINYTSSLHQKQSWDVKWISEVFCEPTVNILHTMFY